MDTPRLPRTMLARAKKQPRLRDAGEAQKLICSQQRTETSVFRQESPSQAITKTQTVTVFQCALSRVLGERATLVRC